MYNCNTDSLGLILGVEVFFSEGHCSGALCSRSLFRALWNFAKIRRVDTSIWAVSYLHNCDNQPCWAADWMCVSVMLPPAPHWRQQLQRGTSNLKISKPQNKTRVLLTLAEQLSHLGARQCVVWCGRDRPVCRYLPLCRVQDNLSRPAPRDQDQCNNNC